MLLIYCSCTVTVPVQHATKARWSRAVFVWRDI